MSNPDANSAVEEGDTDETYDSLRLDRKGRSLKPQVKGLIYDCENGDLEVRPRDEVLQRKL